MIRFGTPAEDRYHRVTYTRRGSKNFQYFFIVRHACYSISTYSLTKLWHLNPCLQAFVYKLARGRIDGKPI